MRQIMRAVRHVQDLGRRAVGRDARAGFGVRRGRNDREARLVLLLVVPARVDHRGRSPPLLHRCRIFPVLQDEKEDRDSGAHHHHPPSRFLRADGVADVVDAVRSQ